jgi:predicted membrane GTPase involved in stress response
MDVPVCETSTACHQGRINQVLTFEGLERQQADAGPGDIVLINGIEDIGIGMALTSLERRCRCRCCRSTSRH